MMSRSCLLVSSPSKRLEGDAIVSSTLGCLRIKLSPSVALHSPSVVLLQRRRRTTKELSASRQTSSLQQPSGCPSMSTPSKLLEGGTSSSSKGLGGVRQSPTRTTKRESARGCDSHEVAFPWVRVGVEEPQLYLFARIDRSSIVMR